MSLAGQAAEVVRSTSLRARVSTLEDVYNKLKPFFKNSLEIPDKFTDLPMLKKGDDEDLQTFAIRVQRSLNSFPELNNQTRVVELLLNGLRDTYTWSTLDQIKLSSRTINDALEKLSLVTARHNTRSKSQRHDDSSHGIKRQRTSWCYYHKSTKHDSSECKVLLSSREEQPDKQEQLKQPEVNTFVPRGRGNYSRVGRGGNFR